MLCCHCLEIFQTFWAWGLHFILALGPTNCLSVPLQPSSEVSYCAWNGGLRNIYLLGRGWRVGGGMMWALPSTCFGSLSPNPCLWAQMLRAWLFYSQGGRLGQLWKEKVSMENCVMCLEGIIVARRKILRNSAPGRYSVKREVHKQLPGVILLCLEERDKKNRFFQILPFQLKPRGPWHTLSRCFLCLLLFTLNPSRAVAERHYINTIYFITMPCHIVYLLFTVGWQGIAFVYEYIWIHITTITGE